MNNEKLAHYIFAFSPDFILHFSSVLSPFHFNCLRVHDFAYLNCLTHVYFFCHKMVKKNHVSCEFLTVKC